MNIQNNQKKIEESDKNNNELNEAKKDLEKIQIKKDQKIINQNFKERIQFWKDQAEREKDHWSKIIKDINTRQIDLMKNNKIEFNNNNENLNVIEKAGKLKGLSNETILKKKEITQLLEDMNAMGTIIREEIKLQKKKFPEKYISEEEIIKNKSDEQIYALGIFTKALENQGIITAIQRETEEEEDTNTAKTLLQFLVNGASNKKKYNLHFDFGEEKNRKLLNDGSERKIFHDKLRKKFSKDYNIDEDQIIITFPRKGSYQVTIIFNSVDFELDKQDLIQKFKNEKDELGKLKDIEQGLIIGGCKFLKHGHLDYRGNNRDPGWAGMGEKRGGEEYIPPIGWVGYGLKVLDVYEDNKWLGMNNVKGEWCVAYHGVGDGQSPEKVIQSTGNIVKGGFKTSHRNSQAFVEDKRHPGQNCGFGVYCSPDIKYAESYAGITEFNGERYKVALMLRINPEKIRQSKNCPKEYILNPLINEIRPYRILLKKI